MLTRLALLYVGLALFGFGLALLLLADIGLPPWDVFHTGLNEHLGWSLGQTIVVTSFAVLLLWIPLRERPGLGTVSNAVLVGVFLDLTNLILPDESPDSMLARVALAVAAILIGGVATGMYIGAKFGPGPRDGLMTAIARRRWSVRSVRTAIELTVLASGIALGGSVGVATFAYALAMGPLAQITIPFFTRIADGSAPRAVPIAVVAGD